ncbi:MAG: type I methionyl aminopeptidase [Oscillospiraceae bacterium]|nr:type I methionyl aminopeptidase [Oscillospiraceae bacterium]
MVRLKNQIEIEKMKAAGRIVALALSAVEMAVKPGVSTWELDQIAEREIRAHGAVPSFLNYGSPPFPASICASINDEVVHGIPSRSRVLKQGDIISIDVGACLDGFHGDAARTFAVGEISDENKELIRVTEECFWKGLEQAKAGNRIGDISAAIQRHAEAHGMGVVRQLVGHGIGEHLHEDPDVPNFGREGHGPRIFEGLVIAVEPMINAGGAAVRMLEDRWTIATADGRNSAHYENTFAITGNGPEITTLIDALGAGL